MAKLFLWLLSLLSEGFARFFMRAAAMLGISKAIHIALFAAFIGLTATFTGVVNLCLGGGGSCGGAAMGWTGLSDGLKFGLSLIPFEVVDMLACLLSIHLSAWAYMVALNALRHATLGNGRDLPK